MATEDTLDDLGGAFERAAERTRGGRRREGAATRFIESFYGLPALYQALDAEAQRALESAGSQQRAPQPAPGRAFTPRGLVVGGSCSMGTRV